jgi:signal transduction histidine kinase
LATSKKADYTKGEVWSYSNLGIALTKMKKFEEARAMYMKARSYLDDGKHGRELGRLFNNIALTYEDEKNYSMALEYLLKAASLKEQFNEPYDMASTYANIADIYQKDGQYGNAIQYAQKSYSLAQKAGTPDVIQPALRSLANSYSSLKDFEKAYRYKAEEFELQDSIYSLERLRIQREMMAKYETEKKDRENDLLKKEKLLNEASAEKQYYIILSVCLALILITFMVIVLWRMYIRKSRINKWLNEHNLEMEAKNKSLEKSIDEKNSLMNVVAHDLKSPLNKVKGLTELIKLEGGLTLSQREYLGLIEVVTEQGKRLISDLLTLNEIEANGEDPKKQEIDLQHFIHECAHEFKQQAFKKSITLHVKDASPNPERVYSNKDSLQRIIDNLVSNAIKFSPQGKNIYVETEKNGKTFKIRVRDEGPGISEEDRKKLFKRFQRLSARPTGGEPSSGLGLAIVKQLVTQLDGTIEVQSKPKEGAMFEVTFPA